MSPTWPGAIHKLAETNRRRLVYMDITCWLGLWETHVFLFGYISVPHIYFTHRQYTLYYIHRVWLWFVLLWLYHQFMWIFMIYLPLFQGCFSGTGAILIPNHQPYDCLLNRLSNGNIFRVTGPLCGEFIGHRWIPLTKASDTELWYSLICARTKGWINNRDAGVLRRHRAHYDVTVMCSGSNDVDRFVLRVYFRSLWWRHEMLSTLIPLSRGTDGFPSQRSTNALLWWLLLDWLVYWICSRGAGDLRRHGTHVTSLWC